MMTPIEAKILATLELIHESLTELVTAANELIVVAKKRQGSRDNVKEVFSTFTAEVKPLLERLLAPPPQPFIDPPPVYRQPPAVRREIKIIHLNDYIHNRSQLEVDLNEILKEGMGVGNWILMGMTDYHIMFHRVVEIEEVDAEFPSDKEFNVQ